MIRMNNQQSRLKHPETALQPRLLQIKLGKYLIRMHIGLRHENGPRGVDRTVKEMSNKGVLAGGRIGRYIPVGYSHVPPTTLILI
jgi:hypothetical protein